MSTTTTRPTSRPTTIADYHRLAAVARERGLRLFEPTPGSWFCSSHSDRFRLHVVTGFSCDCAGFAHHGRCSHHSLLLATLGWLPAPEPPPAVTCRACDGGGVIYVRECEVSGFPHPGCTRCEGTGRVSVAA